MDKDTLWRLVKNFYSRIVPTEGRIELADLINFESLPEFNINTEFLEDNGGMREERECSV